MGSSAKNKRRSAKASTARLSPPVLEIKTPVLSQILPPPPTSIPTESTLTESLHQGTNTKKNHATKKKQSKSFLYTVLSHKSRSREANMYRTFIFVVIVFDLVAYIVGTEPSIQGSPISDRFFHFVEGFSSTIFLLEYLARIKTIPEHPKYAHKVSPWGARWRYALTSPALLDAGATLPFFIEELTGLMMPQLTILRTFRLLRILKTNDMVRATDAVWRVIYYNRQVLYVACLLCVCMVLVTSVLLYNFRPGDEIDESKDFQSISSTMFVSTLILTGMDGPETSTLPWYTKGVVLLTSVLSIAMFAIPSSLLVWGFEAEAERCARRARELKRRAANRSGNEDEDEEDEYSTDEEYQKIIAGEEEEEIEESSSKAEETRRLLQEFDSADQDLSGTLSAREFLQLYRKMSADSIASGGDPVPISMEQNRRLEKLEARVEALNDKVDQILVLLKSSQKTKSG